jgi:hypothetical protein
MPIDESRRRCEAVADGEPVANGLGALNVRREDARVAPSAAAG